MKTSFDTTAIRDAWPIARLLTDRGIELRRDGTGWRCPCPIHGGTNKTAFHISENNAWHCFNCGEGGDVIALVQRLDDLSFPDACRKLSGDALPLTSSPRPRPAPVKPAPLPLPELDDAKRREIDRLWQRLAGNEPLMDRIAESRGWEPATVRTLTHPTGTLAHGALGWHPPDTLAFLFGHAVKLRRLWCDDSAPGGLRWHDADGGKSVRWAWNGWPWNSAELWREDRLQSSPVRRDACILTEGEVDALSLLTDDYETTFCAVLAMPSATIGRTLRDRLPDALRGIRVSVSPDNDTAGQQAVQSLAGILKGSAASLTVKEERRAA